MTRHERIQTTEPPAWAVAYDVKTDITEAYQEATDPDGLWDETCTAFFNWETEEVEPSNPYEKTWFEKSPKLTGILINDRHGPSYVPRENTIRMIGLERVEGEEENAK